MSSAGWLCREVYSASLPQHLRLGCGTNHGRPSESPSRSSHFQHAARRGIQSWLEGESHRRLHFVTSLMLFDVSWCFPPFFCELIRWCKVDDGDLDLLSMSIAPLPSSSGLGWYRCRRLCRRLCGGCHLVSRSRSQRFPVACPVRMVGVEACAGEPSRDVVILFVDTCWLNLTHIAVECRHV